MTSFSGVTKILTNNKDEVGMVKGALLFHIIQDCLVDFEEMTNLGKDL